MIVKSKILKRNIQAVTNIALHCKDKSCNFWKLPFQYINCVKILQEPIEEEKVARPRKRTSLESPGKRKILNETSETTETENDGNVNKQ